MKKRWAMGVVSLLALAFVVGCCPCRKYRRANGVPLVGTQWRLVQLDEQEMADATITLRFDSRHQLEGEACCNSYRADCTAEPGGRLHVEPIRTTRMSCPQLAVESAYLTMLQQVIRYEMDAKMLILSDSLRVRAVFEASQAIPADN
jgi:heat shock protein HslJ